MKAYERARHYLIRKRGKSILIGSIFVIGLLVGLLGITLLRSFDESLVHIGMQSKAKVTVFSTELEQQLSNEYIQKLESLDNIYFVNRFNEVVSRPDNLVISVGSGEDLADTKVRLQGFDDLALDSLFSLDIVSLEEGTMALGPEDLILYQPLAMSNGLTIGEELSFQYKDGETIAGVIRGLYTYTDPLIENEELAPSMYRFENLMFAHPEFINQLQGEAIYLEAHFYVVDPNLIQETRQEFKTFISGTAFETNVNDALFRRMSQSLLQTANLIKMILVITGAATLIVTSLLLILWSKERKREVALFLSIGDSKISIVWQRMLEVFSIYIGALIMVLFLGYFIVPPIGELLYEGNIDLVEVEQLAVSLSFYDILKVFIIGSFTLIVAVTSSCMWMMRLKPRAIFSTID